MELKPHNYNRVAGALLGGWLVLHLALFLWPSIFAVPLAVAFGATPAARRFALPTLALASGVVVADLVALLGALAGFTALWLYALSILVVAGLIVLRGLELKLRIGNAEVAYCSSK